MRFCTKTCFRHDQSGQATVEAAFLIPILFVLLLLLIQPGILLYNRIVMQSAASETCRLLATKSDEAGTSAEACEAFAKRRLGAVPSQDNFHIHHGGCSWEITLVGDENSSVVEVTIKNRVKFLPLFDLAGSVLRFYDDSGSYTQTVTCSMPTQAAWVSGNDLGLNPNAWVEHWSE